MKYLSFILLILAVISPINVIAKEIDRQKSSNLYEITTIGTFSRSSTSVSDTYNLCSQPGKFEIGGGFFKIVDFGDMCGVNGMYECRVLSFSSDGKSLVCKGFGTDKWEINFDSTPVSKPMELELCRVDYKHLVTTDVYFKKNKIKIHASGATCTLSGDIEKLKVVDPKSGKLKEINCHSILAKEEGLSCLLAGQEVQFIKYRINPKSDPVKAHPKSDSKKAAQ